MNFLSIQGCGSIVIRLQSPLPSSIASFTISINVSHNPIWEGQESNINSARIITIKELVKNFSDKKSDFKTIENFLLMEAIPNDNNTPLFKKIKNTNLILRENSYRGRKIFSSLKKKQVFKNANPSKKKFFSYI